MFKITVTYQKGSIKVQASYPLGRFDVEYQNGGGNRDNIKIEIGYMRRNPLMRDDSRYELTNPRSGSSFSIKSPVKEELFANKYCTMISRSRTQTNSRDVFDVNTISKGIFDFRLFIDLIMIEGLLMELGFSDTMISLTSGSVNIIQDLVIDDIDIESVCENVNSFNTTIFDELE